MPNAAYEVQKLLWTLMKRIRNDMEEELVQHKAGITVLQYSILKKLAAGHKTLQELAGDLMMRPPSILPSIDVLEKQKLLERTPDARDRRKIQLNVTGRGIKLLKRIPLREGSESLRRGLRELGDAKTIRLTRLLAELANTLQEERY